MHTSLSKSLLTTALAWCLCGPAASAALYEWQFSTGANPSSPEVGDAAAQATVHLGTASAGYINPAPAGWGVSSYWDLGFSGSVVLTIPSTAGDPLDLTLRVRQFVQSGVYSGDLLYNIDNGSQQGSMTKVQATSTDSFGGAWWDYTTDWQIPSSLAVETVTIFGSSTGTLVNDIQITAVPEPPAGVACAVGIAVAVALFEGRRRRAANGQLRPDRERASRSSHAVLPILRRDSKAACF